MLVRFLAVAGVAIVLGAATPQEIEAQSCTTKCTCASDGCGCQSSGGNGGQCDASGDGCWVAKCKPEITFFIAPDGSVIEMDRVLVGSMPLASNAGFVPGATLAGSWETLSDGSSAARHCTGLIVSRTYDQRTVTALRERQRRIVI